MMTINQIIYSNDLVKRTKLANFLIRMLIKYVEITLSFFVKRQISL